MNIIFTGPPLAGKGTQAHLLGEYLGIPVFSIGALLREAYEKKDPMAVSGYNEYAMQGKFLPIALKFHLLKEELEQNKSGGFILENFPSTQEDLDTFNKFLQEKNLTIDIVFNIHTSEEEMLDRMKQRGRMDDTEEIVKKRFLNQEEDRIPVVAYYKNENKLIDIDGQGSIEDVQRAVRKALPI